MQVLFGLCAGIWITAFGFFLLQFDKNAGGLSALRTDEIFSHRSLVDITADAAFPLLRFCCGSFGQITAAVEVLGMQHLLCQLAQRLSVKLRIELLDLAVFVARTNSHLAIALIQTADSRLAGFVGISTDITRLTAAADASAGTGHHFDKVILFLTRLDPLDDLAGIGGSVDNCRADRNAGNGNGGFADAFIAANRL